MGNPFSQVEKAPKPQPGILREPWRCIGRNNWKEMLKQIRKYETDLETIPTVNMLLVGAVGSGKSSFFNTSDSILRGRIAMRQEAMSHQTGRGSVNTKFRIRAPGLRTDNVVKFTICDTPGLSSSCGLNPVNLGYILDGNVPDGFQFGSDFIIKPESTGFYNNPTMEDKMHCVAYVVDATKFSLDAWTITSRYHQLRRVASAKGIKVVILVTHIDKACKEVKSKLSNAYRSVALRNIVEEIHDCTGLSRSCIFLVKNYCDEIELDDDVNTLHLIALQKMLNYADVIPHNVNHQ